jgi:hypothetical protein
MLAEIKSSTVASSPKDRGEPAIGVGAFAPCQNGTAADARRQRQSAGWAEAGGVT